VESPSAIHPQIPQKLVFEMTSKGQKKHLLDFKHKWFNLYGLQITAREPLTSEVMSIKCRFCEFGRNEVGDGKERQRKRTKHIKFYQKEG
jgi:hypothetical protein